MFPTNNTFNEKFFTLLSSEVIKCLNNLLATLRKVLDLHIKSEYTDLTKKKMAFVDKKTYINNVNMNEHKQKNNNTNTQKIHMTNSRVQSVRLETRNATKLHEYTYTL